ncbi:MAG: sortase [Bariatricus sp.]
MRKRIGLGCMVLGIVFLVASGTLLLYNHAEDKRASDAAEKVLLKVQKAIVREEDPELDEMKTVEIDGYEYIGYLTIPVLGLELPVMNEWDYDRLQIAPCVYYGSILTDDLVIAGHNYTRHFGMLSRLKCGDEIVLTGMNGETYRYQVSNMEILSANAAEKMIHSDWDLTLYTCDYGGQNRVTVRCVRMEY